MVMPMTMMLVAQAITVPEARVFVFAHQVGAVDEQQHENDDHGQQHAVEHLRQNGDIDQLRSPAAAERSARRRR